MAVFLLPVVLLSSAWLPVAVLLKPAVLLTSALAPMAVLSIPVMLFASAREPLAVLPNVSSLTSLFGGGPAQLDILVRVNTKLAITTALLILFICFLFGDSSILGVKGSPRSLSWWSAASSLMLC
jgi:hypothetical protein